MSRHKGALRGLLAAALVVGTVGCGSNGERTATGPTPPPVQTPPPAPSSEALVTGTAVEFTAAGEGRPVPNLRLRIRAGSSIDGTVSLSWSGNELPPGMWSAGTSVHGTVSERIDGALRPVAGATVTLDRGNQDPPATTTATGFYMVCSVVGTDQFRTITARKPGYTDTVRQIFGGWDFRVDFEFARH